MAQARSGGGITMNKTVSTRSAGKVEPRAHAVSLDAVGRIGSMQGVGTPAVDLYKGAGYSTPVGPTPGYDARPGGNGRQVMKSGSQGQHGSATGGTPRPGSNRSIFPGFK
jgi:hypothetical protein